MIDLETFCPFHTVINEQNFHFKHHVLITCLFPHSDLHLPRRGFLSSLGQNFSGWAISVEDWREELGVLRKALKADNREVYSEDLYYTAGYDHVEKADKDR